MRKILTLAMGVLPIAVPTTALAQTSITMASATYAEAGDISTTVEVPGAPGSMDFSPDTSVEVQYAAGEQNELVLSSVATEGREELGLASVADRVAIQRVESDQVSGARQVLAFERVGFSPPLLELAPPLVMDMEGALLGAVINRGSINVFANQGASQGNHNNIERIDYVWDEGFSVPGAWSEGTGFVVLERGGNDALFVAPITGVDEEGSPSQYGSRVRVQAEDWGAAGVTFPVTVMRAEERGEPLKPSANAVPQQIFGVFLPLQALGLGGETRVYGYSLFPADLDEMTDPVTLEQASTTTNASEGGLDLLSGGGVFADAERSTDLVVRGSAEPERAQVGASFQHVITVSNEGEHEAIDARVHAELPGGVRGRAWSCAGPQGVPCGQGLNGNTLNESVTVPAGATLEYTLRATVAGQVRDSLQTTLRVDTGPVQLDANPDNNEVTVRTGLGGGAAADGGAPAGSERSGDGCRVASPASSAGPAWIGIGMLWAVLRVRGRRIRGRRRRATTRA